MAGEVRPGDSRTFTLARHNDIYQEYTQVYIRVVEDFCCKARESRVCSGKSCKRWTLERTWPTNAIHDHRKQMSYPLSSSPVPSGVQAAQDLIAGCVGQGSAAGAAQEHQRGPRITRGEFIPRYYLGVLSTWALDALYPCLSPQPAISSLLNQAYQSLLQCYNHHLNPVPASQVGSSANALLLRERAMLTSSSNAMDHVLGQAAMVAGSLGEQRRLFESMNSKVLTVGSQFPLLNGILGRIRCAGGGKGLSFKNLHGGSEVTLSCLLASFRIVRSSMSPLCFPFPSSCPLYRCRRKRSKDTLVLSGVIAVCVIFTLIYLFSR